MLRGGPFGSEKKEWETSLERRSREVIRIGTEVVWGLEMAKRRGSKMSLGWRYAALAPFPLWHRSSARWEAARNEADFFASLELTRIWRGGMIRTVESWGPFVESDRVREWSGRGRAEVGRDGEGVMDREDVEAGFDALLASRWGVPLLLSGSSATCTPRGGATLLPESSRCGLGGGEGGVAGILGGSGKSLLGPIPLIPNPTTSGRLSSVPGIGTSVGSSGGSCTGLAALSSVMMDFA